MTVSAPTRAVETITTSFCPPTGYKESASGWGKRTTDDHHTLFSRQSGYLGCSGKVARVLVLAG